MKVGDLVRVYRDDSMGFDYEKASIGDSVGVVVDVGNYDAYVFFADTFATTGLVRRNVQSFEVLQ